MTLIDFLLCALALAGAVPVLVLAAEVLASLPPVRPGPLPARRPSLAVLVPAHDEAGLIAGTVTALRTGLRDGDRLLVVADNCRDATAAEARAAGAEVVERHDPVRRGKGYALDHGLRHLARTGLPEALVVVDADCTLAPASLDRIARVSAALDAPVQAAYHLASPPQASSSLRLATFATEIKQIGRPLGASRLGWPCGLSGTGFAVPARLLGTNGLASGHLAEDLKLGLDLALAGHPPRFCPEAEVDSILPAGAAARHAQQTRWEHGHVSLILPYAGALTGAALRRGDPRLLALALDLCVLPLVTLGLVQAGLLAAALAWWTLGGGAAPLLVTGASLALLVVTFGLAVGRWGRGILGWRDLRALPGLVAGKAGILARLALGRPAQWVRTERAGEGPSA
ncbi:glycosyltransferase family 2 protein [Methylobacterium nonmethylotrophicum]|uniref:Glycosyltransferase n=1 Tax=Methylobacterium nonmethylotrophicum TaxID=1141884 RepID=A0A4Z0NS31_9HYPH|nr:glycosyltransferase family 2 protein [Methylobacterium nonmethylotrophicum]TGD99758.1 glycosyltransferase [Methylobacterium nonmethylotrophicum]